MKIAVTGATGLIGSALCSLLTEKGRHVVALVRRPERFSSDFPAASVHPWEVMEGHPPAESLEGVEAVVHLAGAPIAGRRWNARVKRQIRDSRVLGTRRLVETFARLHRPPKVLVGGSAVGIYGDRGDEVLTEESSAGRGFLAEVGRDWESEAEKAHEYGVRVALLRTGLVLDSERGLLPELCRVFRFGLGGPQGNGRQWMSWIHREDLVRVILEILERDSLSGPVNATAPNPVTNGEFARLLGRAVRRPAFLPAPAFALRLVLGEMADHLVLAGQRVLPARLQALGFTFLFEKLEAAFADLID